MFWSQPLSQPQVFPPLGSSQDYKSFYFSLSFPITSMLLSCVILLPSIPKKCHYPLPHTFLHSHHETPHQYFYNYCLSHLLIFFQVIDGNSLIFRLQYLKLWCNNDNYVREKGRQPSSRSHGFIIMGSPYSLSTYNRGSLAIVSKKFYQYPCVASS